MRIFTTRNVRCGGGWDGGKDKWSAIFLRQELTFGCRAEKAVGKDCDTSPRPSEGPMGTRRQG
jgi:hypothetical protein